MEKNTQFKNQADFKAYLLTKALKKKKGVCEDYALLFDLIVKELGYESYIVVGYTKNAEGKVTGSIGHAWNAVKVNNKWQLYDPTWGAGYVVEGRKFVKKYNDEWYNTAPEFMIKTHMPYDPIWQMLNTPLVYKDFDSNVISNTDAVNFDYETLINEFVSKDEKLQMQEQVARSTALGGGSRMVKDWQKRMSKNVGLYGYVSKQELLMEANDQSNNAVKLYNEYIAAKNNQFKGKKYTIDKAEEILTDSKVNLEAALEVYQSIDVDDKQALKMVNDAIKQSEKLLSYINNEFTFLEKSKSR